MHKFTWRERLRYLFDNMMARGPLVSIGWLFIGAVVFMALLTLVVHFLNLAPPNPDNTPLNWTEVGWFSVLQTLNANLLVGDFSDSGFMVMVVAATIAGLLLIGSLIGILTNGIQTRLEQLRKGRSLVIERDHIVILGWSDNIFAILRDLMLANEHERNCIVILADQDKIVMEDAIREHIGKTGRTRIVCRTGQAIDLRDLEIVNPHAARAVIILPPDDQNPDAYVIKAILALTNHPARRTDRFHIVAQLHDPQHASVAKIVGGDEAQFVIAQDLIAHVVVQTLRQSGLAQIYTELLDFEGDEIYFQAEPRLTGKTFGETLAAYEDSSVIGLRTAEGRILLDPPMETVVGAGDHVIAISQDDDTVVMNGKPDTGVNENAICLGQLPAPKPKRILVLGWNSWGIHILREADRFVAPGSQVLVVADDAEVEGELNGLASTLSHQQVLFQRGDTVDRRLLNRLEIATYDHVLTLSDSDRLDTSQADAQTLVTLLHLREIAEQSGHPFSIVSEMLDERTRQLAEVTRADDFIVSNKLVSLMIAQLAENREIVKVFDDLFNPEGAELYLKPMADYVVPGQSVNFYTVVEAARRRGEIAVGYRRQADSTDPTQHYGLMINPLKSKVLAFAETDRVVVLAMQ